MTSFNDIVETQVNICRAAGGGLLASWTADLEAGNDDVILAVWAELEAGDSELDKAGLAIARTTLRRAAIKVFDHPLTVKDGQLVKPAQRKAKQSPERIRWTKLDKVLAKARKSASPEQVAEIEAAVKRILAA